MSNTLSISKDVWIGALIGGVLVGASAVLFSSKIEELKNGKPVKKARPWGVAKKRRHHQVKVKASKKTKVARVYSR